jgi:coenzyme F420 hydrogenase subunit delta
MPTLGSSIAWFDSFVPWAGALQLLPFRGSGLWIPITPLRIEKTMLRDLFDKSILIFGCGNILFGDDGFGPAVINHLQDHYVLPADALLMDVGTSIRDILFDLVLSEKKPQKLIIIDAVDYPDRNSGEVFEISTEEIPSKKTADYSLHQFPTVNMLKELKDHTRIEVRIFVTQVESIPDEVRPGLSKPVQEAIVAACDRIMRCI